MISITPELIAALGGLATATGAVVTGILATRSKVKLGDLAKLTAQIDDLEEKLDAERDAREQDGIENRTRHDAMVASYEAQIADVSERLRQRDRTINHLDRIVLALRTYVAKLRRALIDHEIEIPPEPEGMNE